MQKIMIIDRNIFFGAKLKKELPHAKILLFYSPSLFYNELQNNTDALLEEISQTDFFLMDLEFEDCNIVESKILLMLENYKKSNSQVILTTRYTKDITLIKNKITAQPLNRLNFKSKLRYEHKLI